MKYCKGFKYQLHETESILTNIKGYEIHSDFYSLGSNGLLIAKKGFAWDGASGSIDTDTNLRASLFHDIGCLMVARNELPRSELDAVNDLFHTLLELDGMAKVRRWWHFKAVTKYFANGKTPERREILECCNGGS